jgi:hypothetical protein
MWKGAGGWLIFSQTRQLNFSRTCSVMNHCRRTTSSVSVTSSPILESLLLPQHGHDVGAGWIMRRRGKSAGSCGAFTLCRVKFCPWTLAASALLSSSAAAASSSSCNSN